MSLNEGPSPARAIAVLAGQDLAGTRREVFGLLPIDLKVGPAATDGGLLILEQNDDRHGGPPRHVHPDQDEWFYVLQGSYVIEVGDARYELAAGDSLLAPRGVPHVWANRSEGTGRMLVGFSPAGQMEAFFAAATQLAGIPSGPELSRLFSDHGMQLLGPPLQLSA
jgi:mannose-6-phosphate isomerase-like protein (cupin superfamily)